MLLQLLHLGAQVVDLVGMARQRLCRGEEAGQSDAGEQACGKAHIEPGAGE
jgi:hypothetical protein